MKRLSTLMALVLVLLSACEDSNSPTDAPALVRMIHMVYDGGALDVRVNGKVVTSGTTWGNSSGYKPADVGRYDVSLHLAGDPTARNSSNQNLMEGGTYSVIAFPPAAALSAAFVTDSREILADKSRIKLVNASNDDMVEYELWITGAMSRLLGPVKRVNVSSNADLFAGTYSFTLKKKNDATFRMDFAPVVLAGANSYTLIVNGTSRPDDAYNLGVRMFNDAGNGDGYIDLVASDGSSNVAFVNAVSGAGTMAVAIDGTQPQVTNLTYGNSTLYLTFGAGEHKYTAATGSTGLVVDRNITLAANKKYSVFVTGTLIPQNIAPLELEDVTVPVAGSSLVRFIHLAADVPEINVVTPIPPTDYFIPGMQRMQYREVSRSSTTGSAFMQIPAGVYTMQFRQPDSTASLYSQDNIGFAEGKIYTMWLGGSRTNGTLSVYVIKHD